MSVKHVLLIVLVMVNLLLVAALVLELSPPREAQAQAGGGFNYSVVTSRIVASEDALWILDWRTRKLAVLRVPPPNTFSMIVVGSPRDLQRDFRGEGR